jgi:dihydrofolate reductase
MSVPKSIIVAMTVNRVIGQNNKLPWHLSEDLKLFKKLTLNKTVIMGRKTYQSIGKPLPNRNNIVISQNHLQFPGVAICKNLEQALDKAEEFGVPAFFIGGSEIYRIALYIADYLYVSWIKTEYPGDTFFPELDLEKWQKTYESDYPEFTHIIYKRI